MGAYITMMAAAVLVLLPVYGLVRWGINRKRAVRPSRGREVALALFVLFCGALALLVFGGFSLRHYSPASMAQMLGARFADGHEINLIPLRSIARYAGIISLRGIGTDIFTTNLLGNVVLFIPIGVGLPLLWRRWQRWWKVLLAAFLIPIGIETLQMMLPRTVDVDDVILNAGGILLGWGLYCLVRCLFPRAAALAALRKQKNGRVQSLSV